MSSMKVLGQQNPQANVLSTLYTVPISTQTIIRSLTVANKGALATFRLSVQTAGEADSPKQYIYWDLPVPTNDTFGADSIITLNAGDVVKCYASSSDLCFNLFGVEV